MLISLDLNTVIGRICPEIGFVITIVLSFTTQLVGQPTSFRDYSPDERKVMSQQRQDGLAKLNQQVQNDVGNVALYKERLQIYKELLELNFDNADEVIYADKIEVNLSRIVELDGTAEAYIQRCSWLEHRFRISPPPQTITELYPYNRYFDKIIADYLEALQRVSEPQQRQYIYTLLSLAYSLRPGKLVTALNLSHLLKSVRLKLVMADFDAALKYSYNALKIGAKSPSARTNYGGTYVAKAEVANKLGAHKIAQEAKETGLNYISLANYPCAYFLALGNEYLEHNKFDEAIEAYGAAFPTDDLYCSELLGHRGDAFAAKSEFQRALADYNEALTYDLADTKLYRGWLYLQKAKVLLLLGETESALRELNAAAAKQYIAECSMFYEIRAKTYHKLRKRELAQYDLIMAGKLRDRKGCLKRLV